ncbi:MAG TPA: Lrp/AsnC ligand binding domain-containing protein [Candidatus Bathyarchaeia archaeon]|nr:Lrp/AsnC ligand binding domain-containing protein [Candidatus Bathyarchaeia archaeon]
MVDQTTRPIQKISRKYTFIILAVLSGIIGAIWVAIDNYVGAEIVQNEYAFAIQSMLIGTIVSVLFVLILWIPVSKKPLENLIAKFSKNKYSQTDNQQINAVDQHPPLKKSAKRKYSFLGQYIDPQFYGIKIPNKKMFLWLGLSGLFSGIQTLVYFILIKDMDISVFLPASQFVVVYLLIGDLVIDKSKPAAIEIQSIIMIVIGVILAAIDLSSSSTTSWVDLVLVFLVLNTSAAVYVIFQKKAVGTKDAKGKTLDSTNIRLWTLFFMSFFTIVFTLPFMNSGGWDMFKSTFVKGLFPIALSMLLVYIARIFYVRALAMGKMSIVNTLSSVSVVAGIPIALIGSLLSEAAFTLPEGPQAWIVWLLRGIGAILVFVGIVGLSMSEVKIMILAKVKGGEICDIAKIKSIPGVERVSAITGKFDLMIILRSRTIGRGYQPIVDQLANMPCLDEIVSSTILKEWNA